MSGWNLPLPDAKYVALAWEKNPLAKRTVDRLATTDGLNQEVDAYLQAYTPEENARYRAYQMQDRLRREAQLYAMWLQHLDEMEQHRQAMIRHNEQAWAVYRNVLNAHGAGRKTARITDLMGDNNE